MCLVLAPLKSIFTSSCSKSNIDASNLAMRPTVNATSKAGALLSHFHSSKFDTNAQKARSMRILLALENLQSWKETELKIGKVQVDLGTKIIP